MGPLPLFFRRIVRARWLGTIVVVALGAVSAMAPARAATPTLPEPVLDATVAPYSNVGYLLSWSRRGTGFVVVNRATIVTAGHMFYGPTGNVAVPDGAMWWEFPRGKNNTSSPADIPLRTHVVYTGPTGYAAMIQSFGENSAQAFNQDIAVTYGYQDIVNGTPLAVPDNALVRIQSNRDKIIVGYAGTFYQDIVLPSNSPDAELLHETRPDADRFDSTGGNTPYFRYVIDNTFNTKLISAPGGSGSPVLVKESGDEWRAAGIVVAALPEYFSLGPGESGGKVAARVLRTEDVDALITPLLPNFNSAPTFTTNLPATGTAIVGDTYYALDVAADGWGPITLQWLKDGVALATPPNPNRLELYNITGAQAGTYTVRATNRNGTTTSTSHVFSVTRSPVITAHPGPRTVAYGERPVFTCEFRGEAPFEIQWFHGDEVIPGATSAYFDTLAHATFSDEGTYRARITNAFGVSWTNSAALSVTMGPGFIGGLRSSTYSSLPNARVLLAPYLATEPGTTFQWSFNGQPLAGATNRVLDLGRLRPGDYGAYTLTATHARGATTSPAFTPAAPASGPVFSEPAITRHLRTGDAIRLGRHLHASVVVGYQWFKDGQPIVGANGATLDLSSVSSTLWGDYTLQAATPSGNVMSAAITLQETQDPFWSEILLPTTEPVRSGGLVNGEVLLFGERWRTSFAAGTVPAQITTWFGPSDVSELCAGNGSIIGLHRVDGLGTFVVQTTDGVQWQSNQPQDVTPTAVAFGQGTFVTGPFPPATNGDPWTSLTSTDGVQWTAEEVTWPGNNAPTSWTGLTMQFGNGRFVAVDGTGRVLHSVDGLAWDGMTTVDINTQSLDLAHDGSRFARVMGIARTLRSDDGITWTPADAVATEWIGFVEIVGADGWFAARNLDGRVALSRDGVRWELLPNDPDFAVARLLGIGGGRLYAIRHDGIPLISRALGTIAVVRNPEETLRVTGVTGRLSVDASSGGAPISYQWYRGESGDTSEPIAGATGAQLSIAPDTAVVRAWVRITGGSSTRDSATGQIGNFEPGFFFRDSGDHRVGALVRSDGTVTWLGHNEVTADFHHLRRAALFVPGGVPLRGTIDKTLLVRSAQDYDYPRLDSPGAVEIHQNSSEEFALFDDSTRVTGTRPTGYFRGGIAGRTAAELDALCLPDGRVMIGLHTPDRVLASDALATTDGDVDFDFGGNGRVHLVFNHTTGRFTGTWAEPGAASPAVVRGVRDGSDGGILLANLSGRTWLPGANQVAIGGFVVQGTGQLRVLARGIGPALLPYGVTDAASTPTIRLYAGSSLLLENTRWSTDARKDEIIDIGGRLGAFALDPDLDDSALLAELNQGAYTFHVLDPNAGGTALGELYFDRAFSGNGRLVNISTRGWVDDAGAVVIAGFSISGDAPRQVLLRGIGPTLATYGVADAAPGVEIELFREAESLIRKSGWTQLDVPASSYPDDGEPYMRAAMASVGAFPLSFDPDGSNGDAALLVWLDPGNYTVVVRLAQGTGGTALAEVYDVPFDAAR